jgi:ubiquinone/menaquinone biosynthesis C-methylase UbiE
MKDISQTWYNEAYQKHGLEAQRKYPNEEMLRFIGREFSSKIEYGKRQETKILELGSGSCANLWAVAKEGYDAYGIDFSEEAVELGRGVLKKWNVSANISVGDMRELPYVDEYFDGVFDILSTHSQIESEFNTTINEVKRVLKPGGSFFSFFPSANSDAYKNYKPAEKIEEFTLNGILRENSPYFGSFHPFRFMYPEKYKMFLEEKNFKIKAIEVVTRTYQDLKESFETISIVGEKC